MSGCINQTLLVAVINHDYFQFATISNKLVGVKGGDFETLRMLSSKMHFQYEIVTPKDGKWGNCHGNEHELERCTGLIGMLARHEADMGISHISYTALRAKFVNFSYPYFQEEIIFATKNIERYLKANGVFFTNPFERPVWIFLTSVLVLLISVIKILEYFEVLRKNIMGVQTMLTVILRQGVNLQRKSNKLIVVMTFLVFVVIAGCTCKLYECVLASSASLTPITPPIDTISDMVDAIQNRDYIISIQLTGLHRKMKASKLEYMKIFSQSILNRNFETFDELMRMMLKEKIAFVGPRLFLERKLHEMNLPLETVHCGQETFFKDHIAVALRKKFPCRNDLNKWLNVLVGLGLIDKGFSKDASLFKQSTQSTMDVDTSSYITMSDLKIILVAVLCCYLCGFVSLLVEMMTKYCYARLQIGPI